MSGFGKGESFEEPLELWYLRKTYTLVQAALLIIGHDPSSFENVEELTWEERPRGYETAKSALVEHMESSFSFGKQIQLPQRSGGGVDVQRSTVSFDQVSAWLAEQGQVSGFFGKDKPTAATPATPDYLNPQHPRYASKLAAAVRAWEAVEVIAASSAKSPKSILIDWLKGHAAEFGLVWNGKPSLSVIKDLAKVANWKPTGGAPKTPAKL